MAFEYFFQIFFFFSNKSWTQLLVTRPGTQGALPDMEIVIASVSPHTHTVPPVGVL